MSDDYKPPHVHTQILIFLECGCVLMLVMAAQTTLSCALHPQDGSSTLIE